MTPVILKVAATLAMALMTYTFFLQNLASLHFFVEARFPNDDVEPWAN